MTDTNGAVPSIPSRRGRRKHTPITAIGSFIQQHIDELGMTRSQLAKLLHVSPSTVGRLLNGDTKVIQRVSAESICDALGLDEMKRRDFLKVAGMASFALASGRIFQKSIMKSSTDLDLADDHLKTLQYMLDQGGHGQYVLQSGQLWYNKLLQEHPNANDVRVAAMQIRYGLLLGNAQELVLPWYRRTDTIQTYKAIEENIILRFSLDTFQEEYATLLSHRAPRYRELGYHRRSQQEYDDGIDLVRKINNSSLRSTLFRLRVHNHAIVGNEVEWRRQLDEAYRDAQYLETMYREGTIAMLLNIEAEGYKRLAFNPRKELSRRMRAEYALKSLQGFQRSQEAIERNPQSHRLAIQVSTEKSPMALSYLAQVSETQSLILIDPEASIQRIEQMWGNASTFYPSLVPKMRDTLRFAHGLLSPQRINPLLLFGRDAFPPQNEHQRI